MVTRLTSGVAFALEFVVVRGRHDRLPFSGTQHEVLSGLARMVVFVLVGLVVESLVAGYLNPLIGIYAKPK